MLCFLDADDILMPEKIEYFLQERARYENPVLLGSHFTRIPTDATARFTEWHNSLVHEDQLRLQQFREVTLAHPTWFMDRSVWESVGGYKEEYPGCPEDMIFFYQWLEQGGAIGKVLLPLTVYRYHPTATSFSIHRNRLLQEKVKHLEAMVLHQVDQFTIWGAGRDGKKFFMTLSPASQAKVAAFCDVSEKKIGTIYVNHSTKRKIPIIHFSEAKPLVIVCVALNRSLGQGPVSEFERNLQSMNWKEGRDYWHVV